MTEVEPDLGMPERQRASDIHALFSAREADRFELHSRHLNNMMVRVLKTIGFDVRFVSGKGAHLVDASGARYLDLLSGFGVFQIGRNHPRLAEALKSVLDSDLPNLVQMDVSVLAGVLAKGTEAGTGSLAQSAVTVGALVRHKQPDAMTSAEAGLLTELMDRLTEVA